MTNTHWDRRQFLRTAAAGTLAAAGGRAAAEPSSSSSSMIGLQVGAVSFIDEGTGPAMDVIQKDGAVNTLFLAVFTYGRGIAGRQVPGQPLPDHGKQEYDLTFHGGNYATPHPQFYKNTVLKQTKAPDHGELDILEMVLPEAKRRGLKTICWLEDVFRKDIPNIEQVQEVDLHGRRAGTLCFNNPNYRNFLTGLTEDYARSYEIDGLMWGSERQGALSNALGAVHGGARNDAGRVTCFCQYCRERAKASGINVERAQEGFLQLEQFVRWGREQQRPVDGYYVTFWRILLNYPEIAAWEMLWTKSLRDTYAAIYQTVKSARASIPVGWHLWHNNSFNPIYRAEQDLQVLADYSDYLKIVMYHNCGGERMASYIDSVSQTIYGDTPKQLLLEFEYSLMNYREKGLEEITLHGLSSDYVYRETKRALEGIAGKNTLIWPGIDIDIPTEQGHSRCTPDGTRGAIEAAFRAGAPGVILSRKYSEMRLANLKAAGNAIRNLKRA